MKNVLLAAAVATLFCSQAAQAQDAAPTVKPEDEVSFNAALASDYRYRGISQTRLQPALQGGADYVNNPSGLYAGAWASTIKWTKDAGGGGSVEVDLYAGKRGSLTSDISYDVGVLTYVYPSNGLAVSANTTEIYGQLNYGPAYVKYSHSTTNLFGFANSKNSDYLDIGANIEIDTDLVLNLHAGHQQVKNNSISAYTDWKIGVTKDFGILSASLAVIGTNAGEIAYASPANGKFLGKTSVVAMLNKAF
ncbi:TorF family putative porin [Undibacterium sp. Di24W]|uniref:TorF family putative porin n=1 Tax=Undibacterium sp. Di24W TaxID=3413033 RepID=UPI003BF3FC20